MSGERMIGSRLKMLRERRSFTQEEIAERVGVSTQQVYRWETDKNDPTGDMIVQLARILEVTTDYLLGLVDDPAAHITEADLSAVERRLIAALRGGEFHEAFEAMAALTQKRERRAAPTE